MSLFQIVARKDGHKTLEDSWFWDSEKSPSSASSKDNENSSSIHNLTTVSLLEDDKHEVTGIVEKLRRTIDEKNDEIKRLDAKLHKQHDKIEQLSNENIEINLQIEQLDQQHSDAIEGLLTVKQELQGKCQQLENDISTTRANQIVAHAKFTELTQKHDDLLHSNEELIKRYDQIETSYVKSMQDHVNLTGEKDLLRSELERRMIEMSELTLALEEKEREAIEKFEIVEMEKDKLSGGGDGQLTQSDHVDHDQNDDSTRQMSSSDENKDRCDSSASMASVEDQLMQLRSESDTLVEELKIAREATKKAEDLKIAYEALNAEKQTLQDEYQQLKVSNARLENDFAANKKNTKELEIELNATNNKNQQDVNVLENRCANIQNKLQEIVAENDVLKQQSVTRLAIENELAEVSDAYKTLKIEAGDLEARLLQENMLFQKQIIDLQSELANNRTKVDTNNGGDDSISLPELRLMLNQSMNYTLSASSVNTPSTKSLLKEFIRSVKSTYQQLQEIEVNRDDLMKQFETVSNEKIKSQQETDRLKIDLRHFETEVAELMKNNEILLVELENVKSGKLEPISEHNEDSIVDLEKQLEDVSTLNQSLEDEYKNLRLKMDEKEEEKYELIEKFEELEAQFDEQSEKMGALKNQVEELETEKSNILFELNEYKTDNVKMTGETDTKMSENERQFIELNKRLAAIRLENADLNEKLETHVANKRETQRQFDEMENKIIELENSISKCVCRNRSSVDPQLFENLEEELQQTKNNLDCNLNEMRDLQEKLCHQNDKCQQYQQIIADLETSRNILQETVNQQPAPETIAKLNETIQILTNDKQELIAAVQQKHNESVEYHTQIQHLNQMLTVAGQQEQQIVPCQNCLQLNEQLKAVALDTAKLNDQIHFLREKSDILMGNLMTEQNNQRILSQEKIDLLDEKQTLTKELTRLREHLIEMENAHTAEMVELQNMIDQTKQQMTAMLDEAKRSSTAYTSARYVFIINY